MKSIGLACVALMFASCASGPYYGNNGYGGGNQYYNQPGSIDVPRTAALVAAGVAGLSLYHYGLEKDKRKKAERANAYHYPVSNSNSRYNDSYRGYNDGQRDYNRRGRW